MNQSDETRFEIIPAVDLLGGKVVRLHQGNYSSSKVYGDDPDRTVGEFIAAGARLIHIVDLNAARNGDREVNRAARKKVLNAADQKVRLEIGGGVRNRETLEEYITAGFDRCIIGTAAVKDPEFLQKALDTYGPDRIIVGVDVRDGMVRISGWEESVGLGVFDFLGRLSDAGVREIIYTDIESDGNLSGPALSPLKNVIESSEFRVIASGGISSLDDIRNLLELKHPRLIGAITGKALYEKRFDLKEAVDLCKNS